MDKQIQENKNKIKQKNKDKHNQLESITTKDFALLK